MASTKKLNANYARYQLRLKLKNPLDAEIADYIAGLEQGSDRQEFLRTIVKIGFNSFVKMQDTETAIKRSISAEHLESFLMALLEQRGNPGIASPSMPMHTQPSYQQQPQVPVQQTYQESQMDLMQQIEDLKAKMEQMSDTSDKKEQPQKNENIQKENENIASEEKIENNVPKQEEKVESETVTKSDPSKSKGSNEGSVHAYLEQMIKNGNDSEDKDEKDDEIIEDESDSTFADDTFDDESDTFDDSEEGGSDLLDPDDLLDDDVDPLSNLNALFD